MPSLTNPQGEILHSWTGSLIVASSAVAGGFQIADASPGTQMTIHQHEGRFWVRVDSGVLLVNGQEVQKAWLADRSEIRLGGTVLWFYADAPAPAKQRHETKLTGASKPNRAAKLALIPVVVLIVMVPLIWWLLTKGDQAAGAATDLDEAQIQKLFAQAKPEPYPMLPFDVEVLPFSADLRLRQVDLDFEFFELPLRITRFFDSGEIYSGSLGWGWTHNFDFLVTVEPDAGVVEVSIPGGGVLLMTPMKGDSNRFVSPNTGHRLTLGEQVYVMTSPKQLVFEFAAIDGSLQRIMDTHQRELVFTHENDLLTRIAAPTGEWMELAYDAEERIICAASSQGDEIYYRYDDAGRLQQVMRDRALCAQYVYDAKGCLVQIEAGGLEWQIGYDANGRVAQMVDAAGVTTQYETGTTEDLVYHQATKTGGAVHRLEVFPKEQKQVSIAPDGAKTTTRLDPATGQPKSITDPLGNTTRFEYDELARLIRTTNADQTTSSFEYLGDSALVSSWTQPDGIQSQFSYDQHQQLTRIEDSTGAVTSFQYDDQGRITSQSDELGLLKSFSYHNGRLPSKITNAAGRTLLSLDQDDQGKLIQCSMGGGPVTAMDQIEQACVEAQTNKIERLNAIKSGKSVTMADGKSAHTFDARGNVVLKTFPDGSTKAYEYDQNNRIAKVIQANGETETLSYDELGRVVARSFSDGSATQFKFNPAGRLIQVSCTDQTQLDIQYDGPHIALTQIDGFVHEFDVDARSRITTSRFRWDQCPQLEAPEWTEEERDIEAQTQQQTESQEPKEKKRFSKLRNLFRRNKEKQSRQTQPAATKGKPKAALIPANPTLTVRYFDVLSENDPFMSVGIGAHEVSYYYDQYRNPTAIRSSHGAFDFECDASGRITSIAFPNGIQQRFGFPSQQLVTMEVTSGSKGLIDSQIEKGEHLLTTGRVVNGLTESFEYGSNDQLVRANLPSGPIEYAYDAWGNRTRSVIKGEQTTYSYDPGALLKTFGDNTYEWDARGFLKSKTDENGVYRYAFDGLGQLRSITGPEDRRVEYFYDGSSNLVGRKLDEEMVFIVNHGPNPIAEFDAKGRLIARYTYGAAHDHILSMEKIQWRDGQKSESRLFFFHRDERNNVVLVTDQQGRSVAEMTYDPFGAIIAKTGDFESPFGFAGCRMEPEFGLVYMRLRFYDPQLGRFISPDPLSGDLEEPLSTNPYVYVQNRPLDFLDPTGALLSENMTGDLSSWLDNIENTVIGSAAGLAEQGLEMAKNLAKQVHLEQRLQTVLTGLDDLALTQSQNAVKLFGGLQKVAGALKTLDLGLLHTSASAIKSQLNMRKRLQGDKPLKNPEGAQIETETTMVSTLSNIAMVTAGKFAASSLTVLGKTVAAGGGAAAAVPILFGLVANYSAGRVGAAYQAWREKNVAIDQAEIDRELARQRSVKAVRKMRNTIKSLIAKGHLDKAKRANDRYKKHWDNLAKDGFVGTDDMGFHDELNTMIERKKQELDKKEIQDENQKLKDDVGDFNKQWEDDQKKKDAEEKAQKERFDVSIKLDSTAFNPNSKVKGKIEITGGTPPFTFSGSYSGSSKSQSIPFEFVAPSEHGVHEIEIEVKDQKESRTAKVSVVVKKALAVTLSAPAEPVHVGETVSVTLDIKHGVPPYQLSGALQQSIDVDIAEIRLETPNKPGKMPVEIHVRDKQKQQASAKIHVTIHPKKENARRKPHTFTMVSPGFASAKVKMEGQLAITGGYSLGKAQIDQGDLETYRRIRKIEGVYVPGDSITVSGEVSLFTDGYGGLDAEANVQQSYDQTGSEVIEFGPKLEQGPGHEPFGKTFKTSPDAKSKLVQFEFRLSGGLDQGVDDVHVLLQPISEADNLCSNDPKKVNDLERLLLAILQEDHPVIDHGDLYLGTIKSYYGPSGELQMNISGERVSGTCSFESYQEDYNNVKCPYTLNAVFEGALSHDRKSMSGQMFCVLRLKHLTVRDYGNFDEFYQESVIYGVAEFAGESASGFSLLGGKSEFEGEVNMAAFPLSDLDWSVKKQ